jgi:uncharacterized protein (TIGR03790 family)
MAHSFPRSLFFLLVVLLLAPSVFALDADNLLLITNSNVPQGRRLAEFYAQQRHVPDHRIVELDLTTSEQMSSEEYDRKVVPVLRKFLHDNHLERKITCLVTFYGVPIRIAARINTPGDLTEVAELRTQLQNLPQEILPTVQALEALATQEQPDFKPEKSDALDRLPRRADAATHAVAAAIASRPKEERQKIEGQVLVQIEKLIGPIGMLQRQLKNTEAPTTQPTTRLVAVYQQFHKELREAREMDFDPVARSRARALTREGLGPFEYGHLLAAQIAVFQTDHTEAAFDNELSLMWHEYEKTKWLENPLYYAANGARSAGVMMVMRLDGPQPGIVSRMILASTHVEQEGLKGRVVVDSRGLPVRDKDGKFDAYGEYDQTLRNLADLVQSKTKLSMIFDDRPEVLSADHPIPDVALYMGWYSVDKYVPACQFSPGAVGFHLASFTMVTLRQEDPRCWARGMLNDGIAATLGAVAEPYLQAFPRADDFFPLLMTGKLTLAEVYWKTTPWTSWMISMVGDPLYNPYKANPPLAVSDLPKRLQGALATPATNPAGPAAVLAH